MTTNGLASDSSSDLYGMFDSEYAEFCYGRQCLHKISELKFEEHKTSEFIVTNLEAYGYQVQKEIAGTGVVAILDSGVPGKTVAIRADMDALPIQEETGLEYQSQHKGVMHACGHDGHMATVLMIAKVLKQKNLVQSGKVKFIFQPAEEGGAGADKMIKEGVLDGVDAIFGYHNWPLPYGVIGVRDGCIMAGADRFDIHITGKGGHASVPHLTINPLLIASQITQEVQHLISQKDPLEPAVLNICSIHGGTTYNVVPDEAHIQGTLRTTSKEMRETLMNKLSKLATATADKYDANAIIHFLSDNYPPTINSLAETMLVLKTARDKFPQEDIQVLKNPVMASEDFSFYLEKIPGCFFFVGYGKDKPGLHTSTYDYNDLIMPRAAYVLARSALNYLKQ
jgi:hippurate hydrolase